MYKIEVDPQAADQIRMLPAVLLAALAEVMLVLELTPWSRPPFVMVNPHGAVRRMAFGEGGEAVVIYMILEDQRRVDALKVMWLD